MAYSPIEQGRLTREKRLATVARSSGLTAAQVALAWLFSSNDVVVFQDEQPLATSGEPSCAQSRIDSGRTRGAEPLVPSAVETPAS